ncbi:predicted protein [Methanosarcina acetivorans C2A]|uniref:Uncharacterized protein n=2 Tax=Methanosarcina acetivorans TaxID=2214 RepID=Q8TTD5_METAC|nr:predicted protein [Methanosarcina acetivorans C2A]
MNRISIRQTRVSLFLISLTFLTMWIEFIICNFITLHMPYREFINPLMLYLLSLFLPAAGLLVFMKNNRKISSRWYLGIPFLLGLILNTFLRDFMFMNPFSPYAVNLFYGQPFIATFPILYRWHILEFLSPNDSIVNSTVLFFIYIFFSISVALFCLSVPEEKRKKLMAPFALSLIAAFSNLVRFILGWITVESIVVYHSFLISLIATLLIGFCFMVIADSF